MQQVEVNDIKVKVNNIFKSLWLAKLKKGDRFYVIDPDYRILKSGLWYKFKKRQLYVNGLWNASKNDIADPIHAIVSLEDSIENMVSNTIFDKYYKEKMSPGYVSSLIGSTVYKGSTMDIATTSSTSLINTKAMIGESIVPKTVAESNEPLLEDKWFRYVQGQEFKIPTLKSDELVSFPFNGGEKLINVTIDNGTQDRATESSKSSIIDYEIMPTYGSWISVVHTSPSTITISADSSSVKEDRETNITIQHKDYKWLKTVINVQQAAVPSFKPGELNMFMMKYYSLQNKKYLDALCIIRDSGIQGYIDGGTTPVSIDDRLIGYGGSNADYIGVEPRTGSKTQYISTALLYNVDQNGGNAIDNQEAIIFNAYNVPSTANDGFKVEFYLGTWGGDYVALRDLHLQFSNNINPYPPKALDAQTIELNDNNLQEIKWESDIKLKNSQNSSGHESDINFYNKMCTLTWHKSNNTYTIQVHEEVLEIL